MHIGSMYGFPTIWFERLYINSFFTPSASVASRGRRKLRTRPQKSSSQQAVRYLSCHSFGSIPPVA